MKPANVIQVDMTAIAKVIRAYRSFGYEVRIGNPDCLPTCLYQDSKSVHVSFAVSMSDCLVFNGFRVWLPGDALWSSGIPSDFHILSRRALCGLPSRWHRPFELHLTSFGSTMVVRGCKELASFMGNVRLPLSKCVYYFGARHTGFRVP
jgi:hypothetical protein